LKDFSSTSSEDNPLSQTPNSSYELEEGPHIVRRLAKSQINSDDIHHESYNYYKRNPKMLNEPSVQSQVLMSAIPPRLRKVDEYQKIKSNSTSSLFVDFTIANPVMSEIIECLARALYYNIRQSEVKGSPTPGPITFIFSEERFPLNNDFDLENSPSLNRIKYFLSLIFNGEKLSAECAVMALAYIDRLLSLTNIHLHASNWRRITLGAIILASKVWEDQAVWNVDFLNVFPYISVDDLNRIERQYLNAIQYMVTLKSSVYTKYFLDLRSLSEKTNFPLEPLSEEKLKNLEIKSQHIEEEFNVQMPNRSRSEDTRGKIKVNKGKKKPAQ